MCDFISNKPSIKLIKAFKNPVKNIAATAKTCYSNRGIITEDDIHFPKDQNLVKELFKSGHHTTYEHAYFQFGLSNVSRHLVWSLLHSHPYYNSEQVSQRYTEVKENSVIVPFLKGREKAIYLQTIERQYRFYKKLNELLFPLIEKVYFKIFPARKKIADKYRNEVRKKCHEIARYILPIGTFTYLYHTISLITIIRLYKIVNLLNSTIEEKYVVNKMMDEVLKWDPDFVVIKNYLDKKKENDFNPLLNFGMFTNEHKKSFDRDMDTNSSILIDYNKNAEKTLIDSIKMILGQSSSDLRADELIDIVLKPEKNYVLAEILNLSNHDILSRTLNHIKYTFKKKISHTADSQNQRHRTIPASRPNLSYQDLSEPDYITPYFIRETPFIENEYKSMMNYIWDNINDLQQIHANKENILYLLPNAYPIRLIETGSLLNYHHKYSQRLCYNAQEEIWNNSIDEVRQIRKINPTIGEALLPPCTIRYNADRFPICPEGKRFCGIKVWKLKLNEYKRTI